ncbi:MAG: AraC family transcriptional regulator [Clostridia bacterium]|nr:AraC family transcriptional regulator [Clostridia bacterium]
MSASDGITLSRSIRVTGLVSAFHAHLPADFHYDGESHDAWEFVFIERGSVKARADHKSYILKKGELVCHKPGEFHCIRPYHGDADIIIFCFHCSSEKMKFFNNKILFVNQRQKQYLNDIAAISSELLLPKTPLDIARDGGMDRNPAATAEAEQLMLNTMELLILSLMTAEGTERQKRAESYALHLQRKNLTADIKAYVTENLGQKLLLSDISKHVSYSTSSIKRIFREEMGCSVIHFVTDLRVAKAKELLHRGVSISQIAEEVGFDTVNYFSTVFKRYTGMSPTEFRAKHGQ